MTQKERDQLAALKKAKDSLITQRQAAEEIGLSERQVRRMLLALKAVGDKSVIHASRGKRSNRGIEAGVRQQAIVKLSQSGVVAFSLLGFSTSAVLQRRCQQPAAPETIALQDG